MGRRLLSSADRGFDGGCLENPVAKFSTPETMCPMLEEQQDDTLHA
jgi:hypothetical protein